MRSGQAGVPSEMDGNGRPQQLGDRLGRHRNELIEGTLLRRCAPTALRATHPTGVMIIVRISLEIRRRRYTNPAG
jgi:hypothetical protein